MAAPPVGGTIETCLEVVERIGESPKTAQLKKWAGAELVKRVAQVALPLQLQLREKQELDWERENQAVALLQLLEEAEGLIDKCNESRFYRLGIRRDAALDQEVEVLNHKLEQARVVAFGLESHRAADDDPSDAVGLFLQGLALLRQSAGGGEGGEQEGGGKGPGNLAAGHMARGLQLLERAAGMRHVGAQCELGLHYLWRAEVPDKPRGFKWCRAAAELGDRPAQELLAWCYETGAGTPKNPDRAAEWRLTAQENTDTTTADSSSDGGNGGVRGDPSAVDRAALQILQLEAEASVNRSEDVLNNLGRCLERGWGRGRALDAAQAVRWYKASADEGHPMGLNNYGRCFQVGRGVPPDTQAAVTLYRKAAEKGSPAGTTNLGWCYEHGEGAAKDERRAAKLYSQAANQGFVPAQNNLGVCYLTGRGVAQMDQEKGVEWLMQAAEGCNVHAEFNMGRCYEVGLGMPAVEREVALQYYGKAADQGHAGAADAFERLLKEGT